MPEQILLKVLNAVDVAIATGELPQSVFRDIGAHNRDAQVQFSYPYQVVPDDDSAGLSLPDHVLVEILKRASEVGVDQYFLPTSPECGGAGLNFSHALLPVAGRLIPPGYVFVHLGETGLALRGLNISCLDLLDRTELRKLRQSLMVNLGLLH